MKRSGFMASALGVLALMLPRPSCGAALEPPGERREVFVCQKPRGHRGQHHNYDAATKTGVFW